MHKCLYLYLYLYMYVHVTVKAYSTNTPPSTLFYPSDYWPYKAVRYNSND